MRPNNTSTNHFYTSGYHSWHSFSSHVNICSRRKFLCKYESNDKQKFKSWNLFPSEKTSRNNLRSYYIIPKLRRYYHMGSSDTLNMCSCFCQIWRGFSFILSQSGLCLVWMDDKHRACFWCSRLQTKISWNTYELSIHPVMSLQTWSIFYFRSQQLCFLIPILKSKEAAKSSFSMTCSFKDYTSYKIDSELNCLKIGFERNVMKLMSSQPVLPHLC